MKLNVSRYKSRLLALVEHSSLEKDVHEMEREIHNLKVGANEKILFKQVKREG